MLDKRSVYVLPWKWDSAQLNIDKVHAHNVSEDHDGILCALVFGVGEVGPDFVN